MNCQMKSRFAWIAIGVLAVAVLAAVLLPAISRANELKRDRSTRAALYAVHIACEEYYAANGRYPALLQSLKELPGGDIVAARLDGYGNQPIYRVASDGAKYELSSSGANGIPGDSDDYRYPDEVISNLRASIQNQRGESTPLDPAIYGPLIFK
jgi:type II secretory pathway pseudopilin PulG